MMKIAFFLVLFSSGDALKLNRATFQPEDPAKWNTHWVGELEFWDGWIRSGGSSWPHEFKSRMDRSTKYVFADELLRGKQDGQKSFRVLDVGSGPVTFVGYTMPGYDLNVIATDPLADEYDRLWNKHNKQPPIKSIPLQAEKLTQHLEQNSFDLVSSRNALDHGVDPMQAIREMLQLVKPGHKVILMNFINEGEHAGYGHMEQWNFMNENGALHIWKPGADNNINVSDKLRGLATVSCTHNNVKVKGTMMQCDILKN